MPLEGDLQAALDDETPTLDDAKDSKHHNAKHD